MGLGKEEKCNDASSPLSGRHGSQKVLQLIRKNLQENISIIIYHPYDYYLSTSYLILELLCTAWLKNMTFQVSQGSTLST